MNRIPSVNRYVVVVVIIFGLESAEVVRRLPRFGCGGVTSDTGYCIEAGDDVYNVRLATL